jgi:hypothetical protein
MLTMTMMVLHDGLCCGIRWWFSVVLEAMRGGGGHGGGARDGGDFG